MDRQKEERSKAYSLVTKYKKTHSKKSNIFCLNFGCTFDFALDLLLIFCYGRSICEIHLSALLYLALKEISKTQSEK